MLALFLTMIDTVHSFLYRIIWVFIQHAAHIHSF